MYRSNGTQNTQRTQDNRLLYHFSFLPHFDIYHYDSDCDHLLSISEQTLGNMEHLLNGSALGSGVDAQTALTMLWWGQFVFITESQIDGT